MADMARKIRFMPAPHTLYEVTIRTVQERFLLTPSAVLNSIVLGVIGRALVLYPGMRIYGIKVMSNHIHIILSGPDVKMFSAFMGYINGNIAREVGRLHGWRDRFWSRRYTSLPIRDRKSMLKRMKYLMANGCKEGLVRSPLDWPGVGSERALVNGEKLEGVWYDRTAYYKAKQRGKDVGLDDFAITYEIQLTTLPVLDGKSDEAIRQFYHEMVREVEEETRRQTLAENREVAGARAVASMDPHSRPRQTEQTPAPACHASSRRTRRKFVRAYKRFVAQYQRAVEKMKNGELGVEFPSGCFLPPLAYCGKLASGTAPV
jgi:REP element-mobilizing transposase RayT